MRKYVECLYPCLLHTMTPIRHVFQELCAIRVAVSSPPPSQHHRLNCFHPWAEADMSLDDEIEALQPVSKNYSFMFTAIFVIAFIGTVLNTRC